MKNSITFILFIVISNTIIAQIPRVESWDETKRAYANNPGWNYITSLDKGEVLKIEINNGAFFEEGRWKSNGQNFYAIGTKHSDNRHPYPNKNAMAILFKVGDKDSDSEIERLCCELKSSAPDNWKYAPYSVTLEGYKDNTPIYWMVNDWQSGGLGDNSGYLTLYLSFK